MVKKNIKNSSSRNTETFDMFVKKIDWIVTNLLDSRDRYHTDMKAEKLEKVKLLFRSHIASRNLAAIELVL